MTCYLPYPLYLNLQAFSGTVPGACFSSSDSPQPDPFPPLPPPSSLSPPLVRLFLRYYGSVRLPTSVHRCRAPLRFTARPSLFGQTWDLPVPVQKASRHAQGLRPRGVNTLLALAKRIMLPSVRHKAVGTPFFATFRGSIPGPFFPLSTLRLYPYGHLRMTRGRAAGYAFIVWNFHPLLSAGLPALLRLWSSFLDPFPEFLAPLSFSHLTFYNGIHVYVH